VEDHNAQKGERSKVIPSPWKAEKMTPGKEVKENGKKC
jgi:hypothetical protein